MLVLTHAYVQYDLKAVMHRTVKAYRLLIIDEIGYLPMNREQANVFFQMIVSLYEKASIVVTSNLSFGQWDDPLPRTQPSPQHFWTGCCTTRTSWPLQARAIG